MSCFDTVIFTCPRCDSSLEVQSKAGKCNMEEIDCREVPIGIADAIRGEKVRCEKCNRSWKVVALTLPSVTPMGLF